MEILADVKTRGRRSWERHVVAVAALFVSAGLLAALLAMADLGRLVETLRTVNPWWLIAAAALSLLTNTIVAADRWRIVLNWAGCRIRLFDVIRIELGASPFTNFLPLKSGELVPAAYVSRVYQRDFETILGTKLMEKYLVGIGLLAVMAAGTLGSGLIAYAAAFAAVLFAVLVFLLNGCARRLAVAVIGAIHPRLGVAARRLLSSFENIPTGRKIYLVFHSLVFNLLTILFYAMCLRSLGVDVPAAKLLYNVPLIELISFLPVTAGGLGAREATTLVSMVSFADHETLLAAGMLFTLVDQLLISLPGFLFWRSLIKTAAETPSMADATRHEAGM